jgi:CHAT domain-containing protein/tetratricopeptide (TPR) repeat protein
MRPLILLYLAGSLVAGSAPGQPPAPKPMPLTKEQQERLRERDRLRKEADQLWVTGKRAEAIAIGAKGLAIEREVFGNLHPDVVRSLQDLASRQTELEDFPAARQARQEALAILVKLLGPEHWRVADARIALEGVERLARLGPADRRRLQEAFGLTLQAVDLMRQGRVRAATPLAEKATQTIGQLLGERQPAHANGLNLLAGLYQAQGDYARAEALFRRALAITRQAVGQRHPAYALCLNNLGGLYQVQGEYARAEALFQQALAVRRATLGERHADYGTSLNNLAGVYDTLGEYGRAERLYRQALEITRQTRGEGHPEYARTLSNLATLSTTLGEYDRAEPLLRQVQEIRRKELGEHHPDYASSLINLGQLYRARGQNGRAERLYRQALGIIKQARPERHSEYVRILNNLARLYDAQGDDARAEPLYRQAIAALCRDEEGPPVEVEQLTAADVRPVAGAVTPLANYCGFVGHRLGSHPTVAQLRAADHAFALALAVRERVRQEVLEEDASKLAQGTHAADLVPRRIVLCQQLFSAEGQAADLEAALATAEQGSARVFLEQLGRARALAVGGVSPQFRDQEAGLRRQLRVIEVYLAREQAKPAAQRDPDKVGQLLDDQKRVEARLAELIRQMEREYPWYAALKYPRPCSLAEARACLAPTEVALLFVPGYEQSCVVLVEARPAEGDRARGLAVYPLPAGDEIADGISCLADRETLGLMGKARATGKQAYELLLAPLKERMRGKDLVIVPGGPLGYVPFEALVEDGRFLIERHRVRYAPSLTALHLIRLWEATRPLPTRPLWALGDPVYDPKDVRLQDRSAVDKPDRDAAQEIGRREDRPEADFRRLVHSGAEVEAIARLLEAPADSVLTGPRALEAAVKEASTSGALAKARFVHFAAHGVLGLDRYQQPALVLSLVGNDGDRDAEGGVNDGFLRLDEVTRLRLNADLVVLSACRTGRGRRYAGEGVTGLARAFLYAGSRGVVCSLWSVDDRETAALMTQLYGGLKGGKPAADALRAAKLAMIRAGKPPVYWAPFVLIGE